MGDAGAMTPLLQIEGLRTVFRGARGDVPAVDGVSLSVARGRTLGIVGESGCGKSMLSLSVMRLVPPPGRVAAGRVLFGGEDLLGLPASGMRAMRGNRIAMIFQEPMTSLNPVYTVGDQITEAMRAHDRGAVAGGAEGAGHRGAGPGAHPVCGAAFRRLPAPDERRHAPAGHDRHGAVVRPGPADRRRTDHGARCDGAGADPGPAARFAETERHGDHPDHARPGRGGGDGGRGGGDVRRPRGGAHGRHGDLRRSAAPLHAGPAGQHPQDRGGPRRGCWPSRARSPPPFDLPAGCRFHPRCVFRAEACTQDGSAALRELGPDHQRRLHPCARSRILRHDGSARRAAPGRRGCRSTTRCGAALVVSRVVGTVRAVDGIGFSLWRAARRWRWWARAAAGKARRRGWCCG